MENILAFDQSVTATACVCFKIQEDDKIIYVSKEVFKPKTTGIYRLRQINDWIGKKIVETKPLLLIREMHNQIQYGAAGQILSVGTMIDLYADQHGMLSGQHYMMIPAGVWKKFMTGKGNLKKDTSYLIHINKAIAQCKFMNHVDVATIYDDNIADAACLGITGYAAYMTRFRPQVLNLSKESEDVVKKNMDRIFEYGKRL